ncbi:MAG: family 10 glycosylhydrolase [Planctomycetes bacterium]|nr:family 10 glycosylhydrolase [Planctomycetota bacterium]MBL7037979.1 family 10 glycosylhydrolase [Pirellulaceae bacterium]
MAMTKPLTYLAVSVLLFASLARAAEPQRLVVFNDDAQVLSEAPEEGTSAFVRDWLDRESEAVPFTTLVFLAATPDVCTFDSKVGEVYGARFGPAYNKNWTPAMRGLRAEGTDALHLVTEHMHKKGKKVLAAIRMSDTHHRSLDRSNPLCPQFAVDHPEYVIKQPDGRTNETALDYSYPEVRQHRMAIMRDIAERYDVDGLELNFVRWAKHFPRDKGREKAPIMTDYVGEVRRLLDAAAKNRGFSDARSQPKRLTLGVRVPESLHACWLAGVDIETWVKNGWIDYVVISTWNNTDPQLPVEDFAQFTKPAGVDTIVVMGNMIGAIWSGPPKILDRPVAMSAKHADGYVGMLLTEAEARGAAANYYAWGADSISFWNVGIHFGRAKTAAPEQRERIARWTQAVQDPKDVCAGPRTYRYLPMGKGLSSRKPPTRNYPWYDEGRSPLGQPNSPVLEFATDAIGKRLVFPFRMADGRDGERLAGRLRFWIYYLSADDALQVDINGRPINPEKTKKFPAGEFRGGLPGMRFEVDLADCPPFAGDNQLGLTLKTAAERKQVPYMEELEITVE